MNGRAKEHPILQKVFAGLIVLVIGGAGSCFIGWERFVRWCKATPAAIGTAASRLWHAVLAVFSFGVPVWALVLLAVGVLAFRWCLRRWPAKPEQKPFFFHDLNWCFQHGVPIPFCPRCDLQVHPSPIAPGLMFRQQGPTFYKCDRCKRDLTMFKEGPHEYLVDQVIREFQREKRVGVQAYKG